MATTVTVKQNDTKPMLSGSLKEVDGNAIDLTGCTVKFIMRSSTSDTAKVSGSCTVLSASAGTVQYAWVSGDTDTVDTFKAEFEITYGDGSKLSVPNDGYFTVEVLDDLG